jgi:pyruvate,water dikinase
MDNLILPLKSPHSTLVTTGGKGHNLSILLRDGSIPVPDGFCVTVSAYRQFVRVIQDEIDQVLSILDITEGDNDNESNQLNEVSNKIQAIFKKQSLCQDLQNQIQSALSNLTNTNNLAIRSSATCEDLPDSSFAGQHDTYLNISPRDVPTHIIECYASLYTPRAISYRRNNGIHSAEMAVVVQEMVHSHSSGVLFTANPMSGRRNESVVEVVRGLGEALVSGMTEPDRYIVKRYDGGLGYEGLVLKETRVGKKEKSIQSVDGGGVQLIESNAATQTVLSDDEVKELVLLGQQVSKLFGNTPQDIEFARSKDGKNYIVQSRPITTLFPMPNTPSYPLQVFFSFNAVQGISAPIYPAGEDALNGPNGILGGLIQFMTWGRYGYGRIFHRVAGRLYGNVTNVITNSIGRKFLMKVLPIVEPGILAGLEEEIEEGGLEVTSGLSLRMILRMMSIGLIAMPRYVMTMLFPDRARQQIIEISDQIVADIEKASKNVDGLVDVINFKQQTLKKIFPRCVLQFMPRLGAAMQPLLLLNKLASKLPDGKDKVFTILRGLPHNCTTEMDLKLWDTAKDIQKETISHQHFAEKDASILSREYLAGMLPQNAQNAIDEFIDEYGMRGLYEIDFGRPRWREDPAPLMQTLKTYINIDENNAPDKVFAAGEMAAKDAIEDLGISLNKPWLVQFLARRIRAIAGIRELPKFTIIRAMGIVRKRLLEEGEQLVREGLVGDAQDLFLLYDEELLALANGSLANCKDLVAQRKNEMETETGRKRIPRVLASDGFAFFGGAVRKANVKDGALCGEPVSPGVYEGRVRVVHDPSTTKLMPGEILACHGTDPSWTPLFLSAGALVMEVGGAMTHGSVVAREYGIPAIVGLERITEKLKTGQLVRVDGSSGIVEILDSIE